MHEEMQMLLLKLGSEMGFNVWIAKNDKGKAIDGQRFKDMHGIIADLQLEIADDVKRQLN